MARISLEQILCIESMKRLDGVLDISQVKYKVDVKYIIIIFQRLC